MLDFGFLGPIFPLFYVQSDYCYVNTSFHLAKNKWHGMTAMIYLQAQSINHQVLWADNFSFL